MDTHNFEAVMADLIHKLGDAGAKYGPDAINLVGQYQSWMGLLHIIIGFLLLGLAGCLFRLGWYFVGQASVTHDRGDDEFGYIVATICSGLLGLFISLPGLLNALDPSNWIAAMSPKLALVQLAVDSISK